MSPSPILLGFCVSGVFCSISKDSAHTRQKQTLPSFSNVAPEVSPLMTNTGVLRQITGGSLCRTYSHGNSCYLPDATGSQDFKPTVGYSCPPIVTNDNSHTKAGLHWRDKSGTVKMMGITRQSFQGCFRDGST